MQVLYKRAVLLFCLLFLCESIHSQCSNIDFESTPVGTYTNSNAASGWTISSQQHTSCALSTTWISGSSEFAIVQTPIFNVPGIGTLPNSPFGGWQIAKLNNNTANSQLTRIARQLTVTAANPVFAFAYAGMWEVGAHNCCEQTFMKVHVRDNFGNLLQCPSYTLAAPGCTGVATNTITGGLSWTNWQVQYINLSLYVGTSVTVELMTADCIFNDHYGTVYLDAACPNQSTIGLWGVSTFTSINYCGTSNIATLNGPSGYSNYSWTAPLTYPLGPGQNTLSSITITNAVLGSSYTLAVFPGCDPPIVMTLTTSGISIAGIGASNSCIGGASGSATVVPQGSATGYNYVWTNSLSAIVGTSQTIANITAGAYTVNITVPGNTGCGTASGTVSVGTNSLTFSNQLKPFCGTEAYLTAPAGSNYQWYSGTVVIPFGQGGTVQNYTVSNAAANSVYRLTYFSAQGCQDSITYTLSPVAIQGSVSVSNALLCSGASNGTSIITLTPNPGTPFGSNYFSVLATGTTAPYSATLFPTSSNTFAANGLSAGTYSIRVFDGLCTYNRTLSVTAITVNFSINPTSATVCPGQSTAAYLSFSSSPSAAQYSYSWSPSNFIVGNANTYSSAIISPSVPLGSQSILIYTVVVTPTVINCPSSKTLALLVVNPFPPTLSAIPSLCNNHGAYTLSGNPSGGIFSSNPGATGVGLNTSLCPVGTNSISYTYFTSGCGTSVTNTFQILPVPLLTVAGATDLCIGQATTNLVAQGANTYTWSTGAISYSAFISTSTSANYSVTGTQTNGCSSSKTITISVSPIPILSISGNTLCSGNTATLNASGALSYSWSNGVNTSSLLAGNTASGTLILTGYNSPSCKSTQTVNVIVYPKPVISISGRAQLCKGETTILIANGAANYTWTPFSTNPQLAVSPASSTILSIQGSSSEGCINSKSISISVDNCTNSFSVLQEESFSIYPNPGSQFNVSGAGAATCILYTLSGDLIMELIHRPPLSILNLSAYQEGVYILRIQSQDGLKYHKLIRSN